MVTLNEWSATINDSIYNKFGPGNGKYWDPKIETMPRTELEELRNKKFRTMVHYLYDNSPFYHRKFDQLKLKPDAFRSTRDIAKGPITIKEDFAISQTEKPPFGDFECISMDAWTHNGFMIESTGGTTAKPRIFMVSPSRSFTCLDSTGICRSRAQRRLIFRFVRCLRPPLIFSRWFPN